MEISDLKLMEKELKQKEADLALMEVRLKQERADISYQQVQISLEQQKFDKEINRQELLRRAIEVASNAFAKGPESRAEGLAMQEHPK